MLELLMVVGWVLTMLVAIGFGAMGIVKESGELMLASACWCGLGILIAVLGQFGEYK